MGVITQFRKAGGSVFTAILLVLLVVHNCQGQKNSGVVNKAKTLEVNGWSLDAVDWDWAGTSLAIYPAIFVLLGAIVIPIALLAIVIFAIPLITEEGSSGRSFGQAIGPLWRSVLDEAQDRVLNACEQCIERVSCEASKLATRYSRSLANRIHSDVIKSTWLTPGTKIRLSKAIDNSKANKCTAFQCSFTAGLRTRRSLSDDWDFDSLADPSEWWNKFVYYFGGRFLWVRKLEANKNVKFYPYLPSVG